MTVHPGATAAALTWPLYITNDLGERAAPSGEKKTGWQFHVRCGAHSCGQSVFCAGNDSGAYSWSPGRDLLPQLIAHLFQCHRGDMDLDGAQVPASPQTGPAPLHVTAPVSVTSSAVLPQVWTVPA